MRIFDNPLTKRERKAKRRAERKARAQRQSHLDAFLESYEWRRVRMEVLKRDGRKCACCGATPDDGVKIHVDHIKNRRDFPSLALDKNNLQVLCEVCNHGKGNWDSTDWRKHDAANEGVIELEQSSLAHLRSIGRKP